MIIHYQFCYHVFKIDDDNWNVKRKVNYKWHFFMQKYLAYVTEMIDKPSKYLIPNNSKANWNMRYNVC